MALNKPQLQAALQSAFEDVTAGKSAATAATQVSDAIDLYVRTALATVTIPPGTVLIGATGPGVVPVPNPAPISVTGDPNLGTGGLS
jgi:hypothetical protein